MSGRGRGRGGGGAGGGRGQSRPSQGPSPGRGGGRGQPFVNQPAQPPFRQPPTAVPQAASSSTAPFPSPSAISALSSDVERKVSLAPAAQTAPSAQTPPAAISTQLAPSSSKAVRPPARPGRGTLGRKCVVRANHFLVQIAERDLHHYDVTITPEVLSKKVCRDIVNELVRSSRDSQLAGRFPAYDGRKSMYTAGALPFTSKDFVVKLSNSDNPSRGDREFKVAIKFAAKVDLYHLQQFLRSRQLDNPQETIQALDVVLRSKPSDAYTVVGRSFFHPELGKAGFLGDGLDYWKGFYQSLRLTQMGLSLNVDMSARAFYSPMLVSEFVQQSLNVRDLARPLSDQDRVKVKRALKGIRVELTHRKEDKKRYKVSGVSSQPISQLTFPSDGTGATIHVVQYFRERYGITLKFPTLPALQAGSDTKPVYLPMELCRIVEGQRYSKKLNEKQVTALLRATCQRPADREESIRQMVRYNNYGADRVVNDFGLQVGSELSSIDARVLPPPMLQYEGKLETPMVGCWNMINKRMVNGGKVDHWTCVSFSRMRQNDVFRFCEELVNMCRSKGMNFNPTPLIPITVAQANHIDRTLVDISTQSNARLASIGSATKQIEMLIIILPDFSGTYGKIKRICETELGIISQCCQPKQAMKCNKQYLENVSLKINVKAGGRNTVLHDAIQKTIPYVSDRPTIIFGADVTHPQPGEDSSPSISAVVASMDWPEVTKYRGLVSAQRHRDEMIHDLYKPEDPEKKTPKGGMIRELLMAFRRSTGYKPHRIIFYRDGVSEGQFNQVLLHEIDAIRKACVSLEENYLPPITFVVVQKRHHTRLFPANHGDRNATDRSGNILPGTVVDSGICHPTEFDFYLCSHAGIQGTSRPTHYHVLYDENSFTADALQKLTNNLCYTYARCTRSVSIVPPAYYAHLAAFRARYYIEGDTSDGTSTAGASGGAGGVARATRERTDAVRPLPVIKDNVKNVMFYC